LALFAQDKTLKPQDVVVMLPDVASASGAIEAVFGTVAEERRISWQLTGVASPEENSLWRAFDGLYQLTQGRLTQSEFIDWLSLAPVMSYYKLAAEDLEQCVSLLERAAVYRCLDGQHRAQVTGDSGDTDVVHSFLFGLERLLLATVLPPDYQQTYAGIQPVSGVEAGSFELIGLLTQAVSDLAERRTWLQQRQPTHAGLQILQQDLQKFFIGQVGTRAWENLNKAVEDMRTTAKASPIEETVPLSLLLNDLHRRMEASAPGAVPGGVVHFSRLGALRLLPYRVVCILGLEDTAYPRREIPNEFDLLAQDEHPRAGDRSRRDDDKGVFLEALMSAQDHLLLFYNGFSNNQAAVFPPSTLINQLVDYLGRRVLGGKKAIQRQCWYKHRLQPFSPVYFHSVLTPELENTFAAVNRSYAIEWLSAAQAVIELPTQQSTFINATVPIDEHSQSQTLSVDVLHRFYQHPAKFFLSKQLKLHIEELSEHHADEEPLRLDHFAKWQLRRELLPTEQTPYAQLRASGQLPVGVIGEVYCQQSQDALQQLKTALHTCYREVEYERVELVINCHRGATEEGAYKTHLTALLPPMTEPYQLGYLVSKLSAKHLLRAWLHHLAWQAAGANAKTIWLFLDEPWLFAPLPRSQAENYLQVWLENYHAGLQRPFMLAVESAFEFVKVLTKKDKDEEDALFAAAKKWSEEVQDSYWRQVVPENERDVLPVGFSSLVNQLYAPILAHGKKIKWLDLQQEVRHD
jgi:exodeoxyribonuclease V gamma subunit